MNERFIPFWRRIQTEREEAKADARALEISTGMAREARIDHLTGLQNRAAFEEHMGRSLGRFFDTHKRADEEHIRSISIVMIDVDHFKKINDVFGHAKGDEVLKAIGQLLRGKVRGNDCAARLGGDEFALGFVGIDEKAVLKRAEEIRTEFMGVIKGFGLAWPGEPAPVGMSIGVASVNLDSEHLSLEKLVKRADNAMYAAKKAGKNSIASHTEHPEENRGPAVSG